MTNDKVAMLDRYETYHPQKIRGFRRALISGFMVFLCLGTSAQELYRTKQGTLVILVQTGKESISVHSKQLDIQLNYKSAEIIAQLPLNSLYSGIDSLDRRFQSMPEECVLLKGKLGIEYLDTQSHPVQEFPITADLIFGSRTKSIIGRGQLEHIAGGESVACLLGLNFELNSEIFRVNEKWPTMPDGEMKIQVIHTVLKQSDQWDKF